MGVDPSTIGTEGSRHVPLAPVSTSAWICTRIGEVWGTDQDLSLDGAHTSGRLKNTRSALDTVWPKHG